MTKKLTVYRTKQHDHVRVEIDDQEVVYQHDYDPESAIKLAKHLGMKVETVTLIGAEFESRFA